MCLTRNPVDHHIHEDDKVKRGMIDNMILIKRGYLMNKKLISLGVLLAGLYISSNAADVAMLPQTGQQNNVPTGCTTPGSNNCIASPTNSDGALRKGVAWPTTRFTLDASGNCITDNLTGLMWVKDLNTVNSGNTLDWNIGLTTADNGSWCGYSDWRMPNVNELRSLINYGYASPADWLMYGSGSAGLPACSGACFVNVQADYYWSSSSYASLANTAWVVFMLSGKVGSSSKIENASNRLFPVRGGQ